MVLVGPACQQAGGLRPTLAELQAVQQQIGDRASTREVSVKLTNGRFLWISIANSPWQNLPANEKRERALGVAKLAFVGSSSGFRPEVVTVAFVVRRVYFAFISRSTSTSFQFDAGDLAERPAEPRLAEGWVPAERPQTDLYVVAIGDVPAALMDDLTSRLNRRFGIRISLLSQLAFDRVTFDPVRRQLVADELIAAVRRRYPALARDNRARVIGVTPGDMYMEAMAARWRFAFSLRSPDNHFAVVSYARMNPVSLGEFPDDERLRARLRKMVTKNIGIMCYGLPLSRDPRSVLYGDIGGIDELDQMSEYFQPR